MRSFVLGNGRSRLLVDLNELKTYGKTYGCNALYREFEPDYLIAVDSKMIIEIANSRYQLGHEVWTNANIRYKTFNGFKYFEPSLGWSSGPTALYLAAKHQPIEIYILGFDYTGIQGLVNNIYSDTDNYKRSDQPATYHGNWERQTESVAKTNLKIKFYRVVEDTYYTPSWDQPNFRHMNIKEFKKLMTTWPKIR
jgi:hypothetical protein